MRSIRVQNLRSLADTGLVAIRPLNILVGMNSSGKSSFLRVFPMLRQSAENITGSGLLLNEPYVDFGSFPTALYRNADLNEITFDFELTIAGTGQSFRMTQQPLPVLVSIAFAPRPSNGQYCYIKTINLTLGAILPQTVTIEAQENGELTKFQINDYHAHAESKSYQLKSGTGIVPILESRNQGNSDESEYYTEPFVASLLGKFGSIFHGKTHRSKKIEIFKSISLAEPAEMLDSLKHITSNTYWNYAVNSWSPTHPAFLELRTRVLGLRLPAILVGIAGQFSSISKNVRYFGPVRAQLQRDYVSKDLKVDSVEPDGRNVAMLLASLPPAFRTHFGNWLSEHFGFEVYANSAGYSARVELKFRQTATGSEFNLVDVGFGYAQILPLLLEIWMLSNDKRVGLARHVFDIYGGNYPRIHIIAIEQPELHLHPALQAKMADLVVSALKVAEVAKVDIRFVIETHSQAFINRIGALIEQKQFKSHNSQVLLFERTNSSDFKSTIRATKFDDGGVLMDWPFGFFDAM